VRSRYVTFSSNKRGLTEAPSGKVKISLRKTLGTD